MAVVVKTFSTPGGKYVYDRETNSLLSVSDDEYSACQRVESKTANAEDWQMLKRYTERGYFHETRLKSIVHPATSYLQQHLEGRVTQLTLQVTCQCNLRCTYCSYSGNYNHQRTHSNKTMSLEIMKKSVDFLMTHSRGVKEVILGFYGGEPLLEFNNIVACIKYIKGKYRGKKIKYSMTTNGTIFNDEILSFLEENEFSVPISFDGPRDLHNLNRVYENGRGSFDDIIDNVQYIKKNYPKLYTNISFLTTVAPGVDFSCINNFYDADSVLSDNLVMHTTLNDYNSKEDIVYDDLFYTTHAFQEMKVLLAAAGIYSKGKTSKLYNNSLTTVLSIKKELSKRVMPEEAHPSGPCIPGVRRPFVATDGTIYPCERVSEDSLSMKIGHIDKGFDLQKTDDILNIGKLTEDECKVCWCFFNCGLCAIACDSGDFLSGEEKLKHCDLKKEGFIRTLISLCFLLENNNDWGDE